MNRPKKEDFKPKYKNGFSESSSVIKQYSKAQDLYIDYLETINYSRSCKRDSEQLPSFLYKSKGGLYFKHRENTDVTEQWNEYLKTR